MTYILPRHSKKVKHFNVDTFLLNAVKSHIEILLESTNTGTRIAAATMRANLRKSLPDEVFQKYTPEKEYKLQNTALEKSLPFLEELYDFNTYIRTRVKPKYFKPLEEFYGQLEDLNNEQEYRKEGQKVEEGLLKAKVLFNKMIDELEVYILDSITDKERDIRGSEIKSDDITSVKKLISDLKDSVDKLEVKEDILETDSDGNPKIITSHKSFITVRFLLEAMIRKIRQKYFVEGLTEYQGSEDVLVEMPAKEKLLTSRNLLKDAINSSDLSKNLKEEFLTKVDTAESAEKVIKYATSLIEKVATERQYSASKYITAQENPIPLNYGDVPRKVFVRPMGEDFKTFIKTNFEFPDGEEVPEDIAVEKAKEELINLLRHSHDFSIMTVEAIDKAVETVNKKEFYSYEDVVEYGKSLHKKTTSLTQAFKNYFGIDYYNYTIEDGYSIAVEAFETILENTDLSENARSSIMESLIRYCEDDKSPAKVLSFVNVIYSRLEKIKSKESEKENLNPERQFHKLLTSPITNVMYTTSYDFSHLFPDIKATLKHKLTTLFNEKYLSENPLGRLSDSTKKDLLTMVRLVKSIPHLTLLFDTFSGALKDPLSLEEVNRDLQRTLIDQFRVIYQEQFKVPASKKFTDTLLDNSFKSLDAIPKFLKQYFSVEPETSPLSKRELFLRVKQIILNILQERKSKPGYFQSIDAYLRPKLALLSEAFGAPGVLGNEDTLLAILKSTAYKVIQSVGNESKLDKVSLGTLLGTVNTSSDIYSLLDSIENIKISAGIDIHSKVSRQFKDEIADVVEELKRQQNIRFIRTNSPQSENFMYDATISAVRRASNEQTLMRILHNLPNYVIESTDKIISSLREDINNRIIELINDLSKEQNVYVQVNVNSSDTNAFENLMNTLEDSFTIKRSNVGVSYTRFNLELIQTAKIRILEIVHDHGYPGDFIQEFTRDLTQSDSLSKLAELVTSTFISSAKPSVFFMEGEDERYSISARKKIIQELESICFDAGIAVVANELKRNKMQGPAANQLIYRLEDDVKNLDDLQNFINRLSGEGMTGFDYIMYSTGVSTSEGGTYDRAVELVGSSSMDPRAKKRILSKLERLKRSNKKIIEYIYNVYLYQMELGTSLSRPTY